MKKITKHIMTWEFSVDRKIVYSLIYSIEGHWIVKDVNGDVLRNFYSDRPSALCYFFNLTDEYYNKN